MEDLRLALAAEVCEQFGYQLYPGRCDRCSCPLIEHADQMLPFCWFCACDKKAATVGRATLLKAKLADQGIVMEEYRELPGRMAETYEAQGCLNLGMPL